MEVLVTSNRMNTRDTLMPAFAWTAGKFNEPFNDSFSTESELSYVEPTIKKLDDGDYDWFSEERQNDFSDFDKCGKTEGAKFVNKSKIGKPSTRDQWGQSQPQKQILFPDADSFCTDLETRRDRDATLDNSQEIDPKSIPDITARRKLRRDARARKKVEAAWGIDTTLPDDTQRRTIGKKKCNNPTKGEENEKSNSHRGRSNRRSKTPTDSRRKSSKSKSSADTKEVKRRSSISSDVASDSEMSERSETSQRSERSEMSQRSERSERSVRSCRSSIKKASVADTVGRFEKESSKSGHYSDLVRKASRRISCVGETSDSERGQGHGGRRSERRRSMSKTRSGSRGKKCDSLLGQDATDAVEDATESELDLSTTDQSTATAAKPSKFEMVRSASIRQMKVKGPSETADGKNLARAESDRSLLSLPNTPDLDNDEEDRVTMEPGFNADEQRGRGRNRLNDLLNDDEKRKSSRLLSSSRSCVGAGTSDTKSSRPRSASRTLSTLPTDDHVDAVKPPASARPGESYLPSKLGTKNRSTSTGTANTNRDSHGPSPSLKDVLSSAEKKRISLSSASVPDRLYKEKTPVEGTHSLPGDSLSGSSLHGRRTSYRKRGEQKIGEEKTVESAGTVGRKFSRSQSRSEKDSRD